MIKLTVDANKIVTIALVPFVPDRNIIEMVALSGKRDGERFDQAKLMVQIQIMSYPGMKVESSVLMTREEFVSLMHLGRAVALTADEMADVLDAKFDGYRKYVHSKMGETGVKT